MKKVSTKKKIDFKVVIKELQNEIIELNDRLGGLIQELNGDKLTKRIELQLNPLPKRTYAGDIENPHKSINDNKYETYLEAALKSTIPYPQNPEDRIQELPLDPNIELSFTDVFGKFIAFDLALKEGARVNNPQLIAKLVKEGNAGGKI